MFDLYNAILQQETKMSDRRPNYSNSTMSEYQPQTQEKKTFVPSEFWCNFGSFKENPTTGE